MAHKELKLVMMISGGGSTMEAIVKACRSGELSIEPVGVIASSVLAYGIERAKKLEVPVTVVDPKLDRSTFGQRLICALEQYGADIVTQNGWLPMTPVEVIRRFPLSFNQHPGPVPEFGGKGMYGRRVIAARMAFAGVFGRDPWTEAVAQMLAPEYDGGVVVKSERVSMYPGDTVESVQERLLPAEHRVQIALLKDVSYGIVSPVSKRDSLVRPGEEYALEWIKKLAIGLYPKG